MRNFINLDVIWEPDFKYRNLQSHVSDRRTAHCRCTRTLHVVRFSSMHVPFPGCLLLHGCDRIITLLYLIGLIRANSNGGLKNLCHDGDSPCVRCVATVLQFGLGAYLLQGKVPSELSVALSLFLLWTVHCSCVGAWAGWLVVS